MIKLFTCNMLHICWNLIYLNGWCLKGDYSRKWDFQNEAWRAKSKKRRRRHEIYYNMISLMWTAAYQWQKPSSDLYHILRAWIAHMKSTGFNSNLKTADCPVNYSANRVSFITKDMIACFHFCKNMVRTGLQYPLFHMVWKPTHKYMLKSLLPESEIARAFWLSSC